MRNLPHQRAGSERRPQRRHWPSATLAALAVAALLAPAACPAEETAQAPDPAPSVTAVEPEPGRQPNSADLSMNFSDVPLDTVLDYLSEAAGVIVIKEVEVDGRVSVVSRRPVTPGEAYNLLNSLLRQQGYASVRNGRTLTIVTLEEAKKRTIPVRSGSDPDAIAPTDEMITQVIPIRYADAAKLREDLAPLLPTYAQLSANASSNALILTDTSAGVRRIVQIIGELDRHIAAVADVRVFTLEYADAQSTASLVNDIFNVDTSQQQQQGRTGPMNFRALFRGPGGRGPGGGPGGQPEEESGPSQKVKAAADERTNNVVVSGPPDVLDVIGKVIEQLDSDPAAQQSVFVYSLLNADATKLAQTLEQLFQAMEDAAARTSGGRGGTAQAARRRNAAPQTPSTASEAASDLAGEVKVVANADTNSLVVMTSTKNFDRVKQIIAELDQTVPQVLIKVLIAEVTHDSDIDLGVEFSAMNVRNSGQGWTGGTNFGLSSAVNGFNFSIIEADLAAAIHALEDVGKLEVLSRPYILASDNQTAKITIGEEVPFIRDTRITETGQTINTIQYEDIGILLEVTPHINPEGLVIMTVAPEISVESDDTVEITEGVNAAKFRKRSAETRIAIRDGQTIVIGGLVQDRTSEQVSKVPVLGDIPVLGALFRRTQKAKSKTELLIFLTPHVAQQQDQLRDISDAEKGDNKMLHDAIEPGQFGEHLRRLEHGVAKPETPDDAVKQTTR